MLYTFLVLQLEFRDEFLREEEYVTTYPGSHSQNIGSQ